MNLNEIQTLFKKQGFSSCSVTSLNTPLSMGVYKAQLENNIGEMRYLEKHYSLKKEESRFFNSAFVATHPYFPVEGKHKEVPSHNKVALYAQERDYHFVLKEKLEHIVSELKHEHPNEEFEVCIDSKPLLERDLAFRAGLGWIGKNTCLLNKEEGSLFFIAEILTTLNSSKYQQPTYKTDHCGNCTKCLDACPTDALTPRKLDVEKCISYRTIEKRDLSPNVLSTSIDSWLFGCDICQTVCPWNLKKHGKEASKLIQNLDIRSEIAKEELEDILTSSNKKLAKRFADSPLSRARPNGLKRNALQIIYENKWVQFLPLLKELNLSPQLEPLKDAVLSHLES